MALISSNTLFHFTSSLENLVGILTHEFRPRLSVESFRHILQHLPGAAQIPEAGIPMVCFCDIPLSQVSTHMDHYGSYGIGLSKTWGISKGISPVIYIHENSPAPHSAAHLIALLDGLHATNASDDFKTLAITSGQLIYFLKPYTGILTRLGKPPRQVRFYDEREWRYLPAEIESIPALSAEDLQDPVKSRGALDQVNQLPALSFEPRDINYIIVRHNNELLPMYRALRTIKAKYEEPEKDLLVTKLVSAQQIMEDF